MKNHLLLPNKMRLIGLLILPFALAWLIATGILNKPVFEFLQVSTGKSNTPANIFGQPWFLFSHGFSADLNLTCSIVLSIICLFMVAFSKEKIEDEYVRSIRLRSLQISVYVNYFVLLLATIFLYDTGFLMVMEVNLFTILIIFIIVYYYHLHIKPRLTNAPLP